MCTYAFFIKINNAAVTEHILFNARVTKVLAICRQLHHSGINHVTICYKPDYNLQETSINSILLVSLYSGCSKCYEKVRT